MLLAVVFSMAVMAVKGGEIDTATWEMLNRYNLMSFCYGQKFTDEFGGMVGELSFKCAGTPLAESKANMAANVQIQLSTANLLRNTLPAYTIPSFVYTPVTNQGVLYGRKKRQTAEDIQQFSDEFNGQLVKYMNEFETKMGNLSCVLKEMGILDAEGNVDPAAISYEKLVAEMSETTAGKEPGFLRKLADEWSDCLEVSNVWPQNSLNRNEFMMKHGRQYVFFECMKRTEVELCGKYQLAKYVESFIGPNAMPGDKFDNAVVAHNVLKEVATPEMNFIDEFFWGKVAV